MSRHDDQILEAGLRELVEMNRIHIDWIWFRCRNPDCDWEGPEADTEERGLCPECGTPDKIMG